MMSSKLKAPTNRLIIGYTTRSHLLLDFDDKSFTQVVGIIKLIIDSFPDVGDALILESSKSYTSHVLHRLTRQTLVEIAGRNSYHVVFDGKLEYKRILEVVDTLTDLDVLEPIFKHVRLFRNDMTLRVSPEVMSYRTKPVPTPVCYLFTTTPEANSGKIEEYLRLWLIAFSFFRTKPVASRTTSDTSKNSDDTT